MTNSVPVTVNRADERLEAIEAGEPASKKEEILVVIDDWQNNQEEYEEAIKKLLCFITWLHALSDARQCCVDTKDAFTVIEKISFSENLRLKYNDWVVVNLLLNLFGVLTKAAVQEKQTHIADRKAHGKESYEKIAEKNKVLNAAIEELNPFVDDLELKIVLSNKPQIDQTERDVKEIIKADVGVVSFFRARQEGRCADRSAEQRQLLDHCQEVLGFS